MSLDNSTLPVDALRLPLERPDSHIAHSLGQAGVGGVVERDRSLDSREVQSRAFVTAPTFAEQLDQARRGERTGPVVHTRSWVDASGRWSQGTEEPTDEGTVLTELDAFLEQGAKAAAQHGDSQLAQKAEVSRVETIFVGEPELRQATTGLASYLAGYLDGDPSRQIVFFSPSEARGVVKSMDFVSGRIRDELIKARPELADRVRVYGDDVSVFDGLNSAQTKVVLGEDWISRGAMMRADAKQVAAALRRSGHEAFIDSMEANLVVARDEQLQQPPAFIADERTGRRQTLPIVAYYRTPATSGAMHTWGAHSSVDHNDSFLRGLAEHLAQDGHGGGVVELPKATQIQRPYHRQENRPEAA